MALSFLGKKHKEINKVVLLPVELIDPNPAQPRRHFDPQELQELSRSIAVNGLLQPVTVRKKENGRYELIAGERRTRAYAGLGRDKIPAIVEAYSEEQTTVLALIENLQRKDLHYLEEAQGIANLIQELHLTQHDASARLGKAQSTIANKLRLLRYSDTVRKKLMESGLSERHARALLKLEKEELQSKAIDYILRNDLNVAQTEQHIENVIRIEKKGGPTRHFVVKDMRIFLNTINKAVGIMNSAGIHVDTVKNETEEYLEYTIRVPKDSVKKPDAKPAVVKTPLSV